MKKCLLMALCMCGGVETLAAQPLLEAAATSVSVAATSVAPEPLYFDPAAYTVKSITVDGVTVNYRAYEGVVYVANPVAATIPVAGTGGMGDGMGQRDGGAPPMDGAPPMGGVPPFQGAGGQGGMSALEPVDMSMYTEYAYHSMNIYVPESAYNDQSAPILLRNYIGGYMPSLPQTPNAADASGRALKEGYVLVIPGARGNTTTSPDGATNVGKAPAAIVDLKAAVRYLRHNDGVMPGDAEKIISDGTSAGGAMSALLGASGNNKLYELYLTAIGAANERDDIFAAVCFCPITDLDHSDTAYEWLYNRLNDEALYQFTDAQKALSAELAALYPAYIDSLALLTASGAPFNAANYDGYIKLLLIQSAQTALDTGAVSAGELAKNEWITLSGNTVTDLDYEAYLSSVGRMTPTKNPSAFDNLGVNVADDSSHRAGSRENQVFGTETADALNFTDWSLNKAAGAGGAGTALDQSVRDRVYLMNPMNFIPDAATATAPNWYIRHGARDRDTAFPIPINLAALLAGNGYAVDFSLPWDRPHSGDYELDELFAWIKGVTGKL